MGLWEGFDDGFEGVVEGEGEVEGVVEEVFGYFGVVVVDLIDVNDELVLVFL